MIGKAPWVVGAICLALILLVLFQVNWLQHSRRLIEAQFDQKVTMALCSAFEDLQRCGLVCSTEGCGIYQPQLENCVAEFPHTPETDQAHLYTAVENALKRYDIKMDFQFDIVPEPPPLPEPAAEPEAASYCFSLEPTEEEKQVVEVAFAGKEQYLIQKMGLMVGTSIFIFLFIGAVLVMMLLKFLKQRQLHELSVDFFNNMAHEFRTPLTNINLALNLRKKQNGAYGADKYLDIVEGESARLLEQVERLLHIARLGEGEYALEKEPVDLEKLLEEVARDMQVQAAARGGTIELQPDRPGGITIEADQFHLSNAIRNIIDNALKYTERVPEVLIRLGVHDQQVKLSFFDNGVGMPEKLQKQIFKKFRRGYDGVTCKENGFGLGLAYVKKVMDFHQGRIDMATVEGKGSVFHLYLPLNGAS